VPRRAAPAWLLPRLTTHKTPLKPAKQAEDIALNLAHDPSRRPATPASGALDLGTGHLTLYVRWAPPAGSEDEGPAAEEDEVTEELDVRFTEIEIARLAPAAAGDGDGGDADGGDGGARRVTLEVRKLPELYLSQMPSMNTGVPPLLGKRGFRGAWVWMPAPALAYTLSPPLPLAAALLACQSVDECKMLSIHR
jgi:hypothetical protein